MLGSGSFSLKTARTVFMLTLSIKERTPLFASSVRIQMALEILLSFFQFYFRKDFKREIEVWGQNLNGRMKKLLNKSHRVQFILLFRFFVKRLLKRLSVEPMVFGAEDGAPMKFVNDCVY